TALVIALLVACNSNDLNKAKTRLAGGANATPTQTPNDGVRRITTVELRDELERGKAIVIDVRSEAAFKEGHIKGARLIPTGEIVAKANELPRDKLIVTYCS
ncbi:MAG TPA: rhodanese-like domain-containing protein, partial [Pyrinomonadaceae bacterium]